MRSWRPRLVRRGAPAAPLPTPQQPSRQQGGSAAAGAELASMGFRRGICGWEGKDAGQVMAQHQRALQPLSQHPAHSALLRVAAAASALQDISWLPQEQLSEEVFLSWRAHAAELGAALTSEFGSIPRLRSWVNSEEQQVKLPHPRYLFGVYDHIMIVHGEERLRTCGSMVDGCSMFLEAANKYIWQAREQHTTNGGGRGGAANDNNCPTLQTLRHLRAYMHPAVQAHFQHLGQQRGPYCCKVCKQPKAGHTCTGAPPAASG